MYWKFVCLCMSVGWKGSYKTVGIYKYRFPVVMAKTSSITVIL